MNRIDKKAGLSFGIVMACFFIVQSLLAADVLTTKLIIKEILGGLFSGAISGFLFGLFSGLFKSSKFVDTTTKIETQAGEKILFQTGANHFKGVEAVGGRLYLTHKRLVFKSHYLNLQNHELSIDLTDIARVDRYKTLGIVNNGLMVTLKNNLADKFVVERADEWIRKLN